MSKRKHISWKTKCAAAVLAFNQLNHGKHPDDPYFVPYRHAKQMTEDQFLSLFHWDHNMLHSNEDEDRDVYYNLTPMMIATHRTKTKADAKIIAKSKRIRAKLPSSDWRAALETDGPEAAYRLIFGQTVLEREAAKYKKLQSRGFDKTKTKGFDGKVRPRK